MLADHFRNRGIPLLGVAGLAAAPRHFGDPAAEHLATRRGAGLFDFSFMGSFEVTGRDSRRYLHRLQTRNLDLLVPGAIAYTLMLREDGSVLTDATVWVYAGDRHRVFTGRRADADHLRRLASGFDVRIRDLSGRYAILAVQGPRSGELLAPLVQPATLPQLRYFRFMDAHLFGHPCVIGRLGYSGELGYEILAPAEAGPDLWQRLLARGTACGLGECGFEAADSLRVESGYVLFDRELADPVTPFELGLARLLSFGHADFAGSAALRPLRWRAPPRRLAGLLLPDDSGSPRSNVRHYTARLTSEARSPLLRRRLGLAMVDAADHSPGACVTTQAGEHARVARLPFYDPPRRLPRMSP